MTVGSSPARSSPRLPGLVIAGRARATALCQGRAGRTVCGGRAGEIGAMRFPPWQWRDLLLRRRHVDGMMQPAVPRRRHGRGFAKAVVGHPAPLEAEGGVDLTALGSIILI